MKDTKLNSILVISLFVSFGMGAYIDNADSFITTTVVSKADNLKIGVTEKYRGDNYILVSCDDPSDDLCADGYGDANRTKKPLDSFIAIYNSFLAIEQKQLSLKGRT